MNTSIPRTSAERRAAGDQVTGPGGGVPVGAPGAADELLAPFDPTKPNIARAYVYLLGGKDHFPPDRQLAERLVALYPGVRQMVKENRRFLVRALDYVAAQGISQYADLGAGLATSPAVHEIVRRHDRTASVVYVDNDPVVINHLWALAAKGDDHMDAVAGDVAKPAAVMDAVQATGHIDLDKPVCLIAAMVLHFLDAATAREVTAAYIARLAPGSHVIITVACGEPAIGEQITRTYDAAPVFNHTAEDVVSFFTGLDVIKPGLADARDTISARARPCAPNLVRTLIRPTGWHTAKTAADGVWERFATVTSGTGQKLSNQRALRADPYIEDTDATGVIGIDETAIRPEVLWKALAWAGTHVGIGAARKMGKGRFTLTPL